MAVLSPSEIATCTFAKTPLSVSTGLSTLITTAVSLFALFGKVPPEAQTADRVTAAHRSVGQI